MHREIVSRKIASREGCQPKGEPDPAYEGRGRGSRRNKTSDPQILPGTYSGESATDPSAPNEDREPAVLSGDQGVDDSSPLPAHS